MQDFTTPISWLDYSLVGLLTFNHHPGNGRDDASLHEECILDSAIRHFGPENQPWVHSPLHAIVPVGLIWKLVDVEVDVSIPANIGTVRPDDAVVADVWHRKMGCVAVTVIRE